MRGCFGRLVGLRFGAAYGVAIVVVGGALAELARGQRTGPVDATVDTDQYALQSLLPKAASLSAAVDSGRVTVTGDTQAAQRLDAVQFAEGVFRA